MTAELFQSIVQSVRSSEAGYQEKRSAPRSGFTGKASIVQAGSTQRAEVVVRDLSVQGIGLIHTQALKCGQEFTLALCEPTSDGQQGVVCTVARWQPLSDRLFLIGAKFTRTVSCLAEANPEPTDADVADLQSRLRNAGLY